jgi:ribosomal protein S18 acetylase RimI-like enzyme
MSPEPRFRQATDGDIPALLALIERFYAEDGGRFEAEPAERALRGIVRDGSLGAVWILEDGGAPCGYVVLTLGYSLEFHGRDAFVDELFVLPSHRGRGLGGRALALVEDECRRRGVSALHLEVTPTNQAAVELYRGRGFELRERRLMTRPIARP